MEFSEEDKRIIKKMVECYKGVAMILEEWKEVIGVFLAIVALAFLTWIATKIGDILSELPISSVGVVLIELLIIFGGFYWILTKLTRK